jgi:hypothetical protein
MLQRRMALCAICLGIQQLSASVDQEGALRPRSVKC